jgi:hypothetical protein
VSDESPSDAVHRLKTAEVVAPDADSPTHFAPFVQVSLADRDTLLAYIAALESWFLPSRTALDQAAAATLCLCCGNYYPAGQDCPNIELLPHSIERAVKVAERVIWRGGSNGVPQTTQAEVLAALEELDA